MVRTFGRVARRTTVLAAVALGVVALTGANPAHAAPTGCNVGMISALTVSAYCQGGTGQFRAKGFCDIPLYPDKVVYGPWLRAGGSVTSQVTCPYGTRSVVPSMDTIGPV